jgi:hypothetical protein
LKIRRKFKEEPRWEFTAEEMALKIDLKPYTNLATFSIKDTFPLSICYKIFRAQVKFSSWNYYFKPT